MLARMTRGLREPRTRCRREDARAVSILQRSLAKLAKANAKITLGCDTGLEDLSVRHGRAARAGKHGQGRHDADAGDRLGHEPGGQYSGSTRRACSRQGKKPISWCSTRILWRTSRTRSGSRAVYVKGAEVDRVSLRPSLTREVANCQSGGRWPFPFPVRLAVYGVAGA